jgi:hypothetical protein
MEENKRKIAIREENISIIADYSDLWLKSEQLVFALKAEMN